MVRRGARSQRPVEVKAILLSDVHGSGASEKKLRIFRDVLQEATAAAKRLGCEWVIVAGDMFHKRFGVEPLVQVVLAEEIMQAREEGVYWCILLGNHDIHSKTDTSVSVLRMHDILKSCTIVSEPRVVKCEGGGTLFLAPWEPTEKLHKSYRWLAKRALHYDRPRILISHVALKEGAVTRSGITVSSVGTSLQDFCPDVYDMILLGDNHAKQVLSEKPLTMYLGSVVSHSFGDYRPGGMYLLDTAKRKLSSVPFGRKIPQYRVWDLSKARTERDLVLPGLDPDDYHRIHIPPMLEYAAAEMYPPAEGYVLVTEFDPKAVLPGGRRLDATTSSDPISRLAQYHELHPLSDEAMTKAMHYLKEVL